MQISIVTKTLVKFQLNLYSLFRASDISREKKQTFAVFSGANLRKNWPISQDFRGKKVKIGGKIGRFRGIFRGKFLEKSADFTGKFGGRGGKLRQETISKKQPISLDFFLPNFAKIDQFCVDMTTVV